MPGRDQNGQGAPSGGETVTRLHATCVAVALDGVLLRGPPGAGKSDLALRLIGTAPLEGEPAARLVSDDQVIVRRVEDRLVARAPESIAGMLEIRGVGICRVPVTDAANVALLVDLVAREAVVRLPPEPLPTEDILGLPVPTARLAAFESSAPLKLRLLMGAWGNARR